MGARNNSNRDKNERRQMRPATTPENRENQMISLAVDLAERQLREGTASAQVISHFLKLGSTRERLEQERLSRENILLKAKAEAVASTQRIEALYEEAMNAMRGYKGFGDVEDYDFDD